MPSDEEVELIRRKLAEGWRGPVLLRWLEQLLQDRDERRRREREAEPPGHKDEWGRPWASSRPRAALDSGYVRGTRRGEI